MKFVLKIRSWGQTGGSKCQKELTGVALLIYAWTVMTLRQRGIIF